MFYELQRFKQWWLWIILMIAISIPLISIAYILFIGKPFGNMETIDLGLITVLMITIITGAFFLSMKLETKIDEQGVHYRFFPFHFKWKTKKWKEIESVFIRKYNPILEFGGWGLRYGFRNGWAYNISGSLGLQLFFTNGKKILIGTRKPEELNLTLKNLAAKKFIHDNQLMPHQL